jgi:hypothetical protein
MPGDFAVALDNLQHAMSCDQAKNMLKHARIVSLAMRRSLLAGSRDLTRWRELNAILRRKTKTHNKICGREFGMR